MSIYWFPFVGSHILDFILGQGEVTSLGCVAGFTQTVVMADSYGVLVFGYVTMLCLSNLETSPKEKEVEKGEWIDLWFRNIFCVGVYGLIWNTCTCNWKKIFSKNDSKCLAIIVKLAVKIYQYKERI